DELPIYESKKTTRGLWQRYLVFRDHVELRTMFGIYRLRFQDIDSIEISPPLTTLLRQGKVAKELRAMKLDFADMVEHVCIGTSRGLIRFYRFTPDDPKEFAYAANSAWRHFPRIKQGSS
ncbi:MAG TPA: hypothetical protein VK934_07505, partial [Fimbriimonas sp.]|nr:hypothetical protein [Fimbriimonas sp.]